MEKCNFKDCIKYMSRDNHCKLYKNDGIKYCRHNPNWTERFEYLLEHRRKMSGRLKDLKYINYTLDILRGDKMVEVAARFDVNPRAIQLQVSRIILKYCNIKYKHIKYIVNDDNAISKLKQAKLSLMN